MSDSTNSTPALDKKSRPLDRNERRVAGVLAEKAKTTPENYPLSINSLVNGCNQKSNRSPQMTLDEGQVQEALDSLRKSGAVALIQGDGRVEKYRHLLYDWLGVDKAELAVMTELLLRGSQTLGELRGRSARMEPIKDVGALQPIVDSLRQKDLLIYLTSPGRGGMVTHNLYEPQELAKVRSEVGESADDGVDTGAPTAATSPVNLSKMSRDPHSPPIVFRADAAPPVFRTSSDGELQELRSEIATLKRDVAEIREQADATARVLQRELSDLKNQLGV